LSYQSLESGIIRGSVDVDNFNMLLSGFTLTFVFLLNRGLVMTSIGFSIVSLLLLTFFETESLGMTYVSTASLWYNDLVKCLLNIVLVAATGEGKCNFLPFLAVVLVDEGTSSSSGVG
jgi:hypothetical protein